MNFDKIKFQRVFSKSMYKSLKLPLAEMTFSKDFVNDKRGDLYPVITKDDICNECVSKNLYRVENGTVERMFTRFFPYATYEVTFSVLERDCGFVFHLAEQEARIICNGKEIVFYDGVCEQKSELSTATSCFTLIVSCRPSAFDIYLPKNDKPDYLCTFKSKAFARSNEKKLFDKGFVSLYVNGNVTVNSVCSYIDCGISQADIRPIRYENGEVMVESGKIFLTLSVRLQEGAFQGVVSWIPTTSNFELVGAIFYDSGDGKWCGDVAASLLFNRKTNEWYLWVCSFAHHHILGHAAFKGDPRFGVNVIDIELMDKADNNTDITEFLGFEGDEDPDFYYNEQEDKWYMAICRPDPSINAYKYMFFSSDNPFDNYKYIGKGFDGAETGGSFVNFNNQIVFVCGNDFNKRANYRIYTKEGMSEAKFDFDDGGFRGWGTVIPVVMGSRKRYFWLTFDRHNASDYNWSYGNIYCFEAEI